jgi:hypothetical protein
MKKQEKVEKPKSIIIEEKTTSTHIEELPPGVTEKPRGPEEMDLSKVPGYQPWLRAYLPVSDDEGEFLGDKELEALVKAKNNELDLTDLTKAPNQKELIDTLVDLIKRYGGMINITDNISSGHTTKYKIRLGQLFNHLKVLVLFFAFEWTAWFKLHFDKRQFRSVQIYMQLAKVPNIIRYAVFGIERLLEIYRQIDDFTGDDPFGDFLAEYGIDFDPRAEFDPVEMKLETDIAIGMKKLSNEGLTEIPQEKIEALVRQGREIEPKHIDYLKAIKDVNGDINLHMDKIIAGEQPNPQDPKAKAEAFRKSFDRFIDQVKSALKDGAYLKKVDVKLCQELRSQIDQMLTKLPPPVEKAETK